MSERRIFIERIPRLFASIYEKATRQVVESYYEQVADEVVSALRKGGILDIGTGPGYLPIVIAQKSSFIRIVGIDLSRELIRMARKNAEKAGVSDRVTFEVGNASKLRYSDASYDMVISTGMLHMLKAPVRFFRECHRVLRPGGEAWIYDPAQVASRIDIKTWTASLSPREKVMAKIFPLYTKINPARTYRPAQIEAMLLSTNFREWKIETEGNEIRMRLKKSFSAEDGSPDPDH